MGPDVVDQALQLHGGIRRHPAEGDRDRPTGDELFGHRRRRSAISDSPPTVESTGEVRLAEGCSNMQNAIMPSITIRDVPKTTRDELAAKAARSGRSLQQYLRSELIRLADKRDMAEIIERAQERARRTGTGLTIEQIMSYKHADPHADQFDDLDPGDTGR